ncbi:MAG TPA: DegT/DnrJ/EryC1/StrS family aminotransferase [Magnetospirillum sp.]|jgi:dTDP-4-amino-4,6-dideoxygalactose transaminase|nr:DegT/DnrJ/EryC1/StrS family aminotransferase [Magnetospirillum sp.]
MSQLALLGGNPLRSRPFPAYRTMGKEEEAAATRVIKSGVLSRFLGVWHPDFFGGPEVQAFEAEWAQSHQAKHAISVNSNTSGLFAAIGAAGVGPGDEVIVSPYTMTASAIAPIIFNAVPVFADIDPVSYCLSTETIAPRITPRTKAVVVVHIFGQPADMDPIMELAAKHNLIVIEDCAQAPFATYRGRPVGTLGHMGVFSLNYHKHIHTGEGGVVTTNDDRLAERLQLIRNHGENVVAAKGVTDIAGILGFNFRLGEIEAAIGREQLKKGPSLIASRKANVAYLESRLAGIPGLSLPHVPAEVEHVYYLHAMRWDAAKGGIKRSTFAKAVKAELAPFELREHEGVLLGEGYVRPLYLQPMYQQQIAYGGKGCPFACPHYEGKPDYAPGLCPETEKAHFHDVLTHEFIRPPMSRQDLDDVANAFHKVAENIEALKAWERQQP